MTNEETPKRKAPLDLHIRCGCGGVFSLELDTTLWSHFGGELIAVGKSWVESHRACPKRPAELPALPGDGEP